jgi:hypothetical protein
MDYILPLAGNKLITLFYEKKRKKKKKKKKTCLSTNHYVFDSKKNYFQSLSPIFFLIYIVFYLFIQLNKLAFLCVKQTVIYM